MGAHTDQGDLPIAILYVTNFLQMEVMDENEWWGKLEQMKRGGEQEMVIKRRFRREDQDILADMAYQLGLHL